MGDVCYSVIRSSKDCTTVIKDEYRSWRVIGSSQYRSRVPSVIEYLLMGLTQVLSKLTYSTYNTIASSRSFYRLYGLLALPNIMLFLHPTTVHVKIPVLLQCTYFRFINSIFKQYFKGIVSTFFSGLLHHHFEEFDIELAGTTSSSDQDLLLLN